MNAFDLLMIIFVFVGILYGAVRGATRQAIGLISAWLGLIVVLWLYLPFSRQILMGFFRSMSEDAPLNSNVFDTFSFIFLLIIFAVIVQLIFVFTTKSPEERRDTSKRHFLDKANEKQNVSVLNLFGGLITGLISTLVWLSLFLAPIQFAIFSANNPGEFVRGLQVAMSTSALLPFFHRILYYIYLSIQFFIPPTGLPAIFRAALSAFL